MRSKKISSIEATFLSAVKVCFHNYLDFLDFFKLRMSVVFRLKYFLQWIRWLTGVSPPNYFFPLFLSSAFFLFNFFSLSWNVRIHFHFCSLLQICKWKYANEKSLSANLFISVIKPTWVKCCGMVFELRNWNWRVFLKPENLMALILFWNSPPRILKTERYMQKMFDAHSYFLV